MAAFTRRALLMALAVVAAPTSALAKPRKPVPVVTTPPGLTVKEV